MTKTLSEQIRACREGVVANPFQGTDKKVLFVCSMGILRSATAARIYAHKYNTRSAGSWGDALIPLTPILLAWANEIVFVNPENYHNAVSEFGEEVFKEISIKVLEIPDRYPHMHPLLIKAFEDQYEVR
jgi:predicted protein tyrosine phosphatase